MRLVFAAHLNYDYFYFKYSVTTYDWLMAATLFSAGLDVKVKGKRRGK